MGEGVEFKHGNDHIKGNADSPTLYRLRGILSGTDIKDYLDKKIQNDDFNTPSFPQAMDGYENLQWKSQTGNFVVSESNKVFTLSASKKAIEKIADKIEKLKALKAQNLNLWQNDEIDWKKGVSIKDDLSQEDKKFVEESLKESQATDLSGRTTSNEGSQEGKIKLVFKDKSELTIDKQTLNVSTSITGASKENTPKDAIEVEIKIGEGVKVKDGNTSIEGPTSYQKYKIKLGTDIQKEIYKELNSTLKDLIKPEVKEGYENIEWKSQTGNFVVSESNKVFTLSASKKASSIPEQGGKTPEQSPEQGGKTPEQSPEQGGKTPEQSPEQGGKTPEQSPEQGGKTPEQSPEQGGKTPEQSPEQGGKTPEQSPEQGGKTPEQSPEQGGKTPEQSSEQGKKTTNPNPDKSVNKKDRDNNVSDKPNKNNENPKTGIAESISIASILLGASMGAYKTKKKK